MPRERRRDVEQFQRGGSYGYYLSGRDLSAPEVAPYEEWQKAEGIPVHAGFSIEDLRMAQVGPWPRMGGKGAFINLVGSEMSADAYLCEIPPGGSLNQERHMFEEMIFILEGRGATVISGTEGRRTPNTPPVARGR